MHLKFLEVTPKFFKEAKKKCQKKLGLSHENHAGWQRHFFWPFFFKFQALMEEKAHSPTKQRHLTGFWSLFTQDEDPHRALCARCRHCRNVVNHHRKSEQAQVHLNSCLAFKKYMYGLPRDQRPEWYTGGKRNRSEGNGKK